VIDELAAAVAAVPAVALLEPRGVTPSPQVAGTAWKVTPGTRTPLVLVPLFVGVGAPKAKSLALFWVSSPFSSVVAPPEIFSFRLIAWPRIRPRVVLKGVPTAASGAWPSL
jgi:hypothetical protein